MVPENKIIAYEEVVFPQTKIPAIKRLITALLTSAPLSCLEENIVTETGDIIDIKVLKGIGGGTASEALWVVRKMKTWKPRVQNGRLVPVRFTLSLRFSLAS